MKMKTYIITLSHVYDVSDDTHFLVQVPDNFILANSEHNQRFFFYSVYFDCVALIKANYNKETPIEFNQDAFINIQPAEDTVSFSTLAINEYKLEGLMTEGH